jgi:hypothetical protein
MMVTPRPIRPGANITLIHYHQRMRLRGFSIDWRMDAAGMNTPAPVWRQEIAEGTASLGEPWG